MQGAGLIPAGILGTRADLLMDVVLLSFLIIFPLLVYSWRAARAGLYRKHRNLQLSMFTLLVIAVSAFEADLAMSGGIFELTKESSVAGTKGFIILVYGHSLVAVLAALIWVILVALSLLKFDNPPGPNAFSKIHRPLGRLGMVLMMLAGASAFPLYYYGFIL